MKCMYCSGGLRTIEVLKNEEEPVDKDEAIFDVVGYCPKCDIEFKYKVKTITLVESEYDLTEM